MSKNSEKNEKTQVTEPPLSLDNLESHDEKGNIFKQKVLPKLSSIISTSSGLVSNLIGFAGGLWDKKVPEPEVTIRSSSSYSSSLVYDDSPDILIVSKQKVYGRRERFSQEFAINLKKLRNGRYSEYTPARNLALHIDSDVQPQIVTLREASLEQRKRTESCYPRIGHQKSNQEQFSISINPKTEDSYQKDYPSASRISDNNPLILLTSIENNEVLDQSHMDSSKEACKTHDFEISGLEGEGEEDEEKNQRLSASCGEVFINEKNDQIVNRCRSIDSLSVSINGKIFKYFDKPQLCSVPVVKFDEFWEKTSKILIKLKNPWRNLNCCQKICRFRHKELNIDDKSELEKIIFFSIEEFDFANDLHLMLLLGTYILVTGESDWPSHDKDWLKLGFSSTDLKVELAKGGLIGLIFLFFLSENFQSFLNEILKVRSYYSFEVFQVLKNIVIDAVYLLRSQKLNCCFDRSEKSVSRFFMFACGMLKKWFKLVVCNKDFEEMRSVVVMQGRSAPLEFIVIAQNMEL